jgi:hypothetical protein
MEADVRGHIRVRKYLQSIDCV